MTIQIEGLCPLLEVFDMPTSIRFYRDVLGFEMVQSSRPEDGDDVHWCWLRRGDAHLMLNTAYDDGQRPPSPDRVRVAHHRDTALFFGCPDVDEAYEHLRAHGIDLRPPHVAPYGMKQLYLLDPDGYNLCFQWTADAPAEALAVAS